MSGLQWSTVSARPGISSDGGSSSLSLVTFLISITPGEENTSSGKWDPDLIPVEEWFASTFVLLEVLTKV